MLVLCSRTTTNYKPYDYSRDDFENYDFETATDLSYLRMALIFLKFTVQKILYANPAHNPDVHEQVHVSSDDKTAYNNKCNDPVFIQTYYVQIARYRCFRWTAKPDYTGQLMCYDYGPCQSYNAVPVLSGATADQRDSQARCLTSTIQTTKKQRCTICHGKLGN